MKLYEANGNRFLIGEDEIDVVKMCNENACDGYLKVHSHQMKIFNADGSEASLCINGLHCFTHYLYDLDPNYSIFALVIDSEVYKSEIKQIEPFISTVSINHCNIYRNFVDVGNKHMMRFDKMNNAEIYCKRYNCNINYIHVLNRGCIEVITYERGVGFTKSCGSGNIASSAYCYENDLCDSQIDVLNRGGISSVTIKNKIEITTMSSFIRMI